MRNAFLPPPDTGNEAELADEHANDDKAMAMMMTGANRQETKYWDNCFVNSGTLGTSVQLSFQMGGVI